MSRLKIFLIALLLLTTAAPGEKLIEKKFYSDAEREMGKTVKKPFGIPPAALDRICGRFVMLNLTNAGLRFPRKWGATQLKDPVCRWYTPDIPSLGILMNSADNLGLRAQHWSWPNLLYEFGEVCEALGGTPHFFYYCWNGIGHAGKLLINENYVEVRGEIVERGTWWELYQTAMSHHVWRFSVYRVGDEDGLVNKCHVPQNFWGADSTIGGDPDDELTVRHQWVCCWKEKLPGEAPWSARTTPYACLNWTENRGTTWDTLISPRVNLAGCSSAVLVQACTTNLLHGSNKTIQVRGSTDNGTTWPYLIGTDTTTEASLPWATNQRNVRIAWIYKGPVQGAEKA